MLIGTIASLAPDNRPWGFIESKGLRSVVFFHCSELLLADLTPEMIGRRVAFELVRTSRGLNAINVTLLD